MCWPWCPCVTVGESCCERTQSLPPTPPWVLQLQEQKGSLDKEGTIFLAAEALSLGTHCLEFSPTPMSSSVLITRLGTVPTDSKCSANTQPARKVSCMWPMMSLPAVCYYLGIHSDLSSEAAHFQFALVSLLASTVGRLGMLLLGSQA